MDSSIYLPQLICQVMSNHQLSSTLNLGGSAKLLSYHGQLSHGSCQVSLAAVQVNIKKRNQSHS